MPIRDDKLNAQPAYARVTCPRHRKVLLSYPEYMRQLEMPGDQWRCPLCGTIAVFDDHWFDLIHANDES